VNCGNCKINLLATEYQRALIAPFYRLFLVLLVSLQELKPIEKQKQQTQLTTTTTTHDNLDRQTS
jgi:hypothetical protein